MHSDDDLIVSHIALNCGDEEDVNKLMNRMTEMGVPFRENISVPNPATKKQVKQAFVRDPDGYYLDFCSCDSLEEFLEEQMTEYNKLWDFQRIKTAMTERSRMIDLLNLDQAQNEELRETQFEKWGKVKAIKLYAGEFCNNASESEIADLESRFHSTSAILSVLKEKENIPTFQNCVQNNKIEHVKLLCATSSGKLDALRKGFQEGMDMNFVDYGQRTCLHLASAEGYLDCVSFLVTECCVDSHLKDRRGFSPFQCAEENNHKEVMDFLQENKSHVKEDVTLSDAELEEIKVEIKEWIGKSENEVLVDDVKLANLVDRQNVYGDITQNATKEELQSLLEMFNNHVPHVIVALREKVIAKGSRNFIPPAFYERNKSLFQPPSFQMIVEKKEKATTDLAVIFAASSGNLTALRSAHDAGVDMNGQDYDKRTALHQACAGNKMDCIRFLVEEVMVELEPRDRWGATPLDNAKEEGNMELIELLKKKISKMNHEKDAAINN